MALVNLVLASVPSANTRESYAKGIRDLVAFSEGRPITRILLLEWRAAMKAAGRSSSTVNLRISAARALVREARNSGAIDLDQAFDLLRVGGLPSRGSRSGNWLTETQVDELLAVPDRKTLRGKRDYCVLAMLVGCALRREELATLNVEDIERRVGRWALPDLESKGGRVRTVGIQPWVKQAIDEWTAAAKIRAGRLIRRTTLDPVGLSSQTIWQIVRRAGAKIGVAHFGPHDLRRTCAKHCRAHGADIEQIQVMLGHADIRTTARYLGTEQDLVHAPNDRLVH
ncbi:MAG TPA: tyrosine-type recombinase/integrase [Acidobacteriaceae bacterium]